MPPSPLRAPFQVSVRALNGLDLEELWIVAGGAETPKAPPLPPSAPPLQLWGWTLGCLYLLVFMSALARGADFPLLLQYWLELGGSKADYGWMAFTFSGCQMLTGEPHKPDGRCQRPPNTACGRLNQRAAALRCARRPAVRPAG